MNAVGVGNRRILHEHPNRPTSHPHRSAQGPAAKHANTRKTAGAIREPAPLRRLRRFTSFSCLTGSFDRAQQS